MAACSGNSEVVKLLLDAGLAKNKMTEDGDKPLDTAKEYGQFSPFLSSPSLPSVLSSSLPSVLLSFFPFVLLPSFL